jgi:hypothetical protein
LGLTSWSVEQEKVRAKRKRISPRKKEYWITAHIVLLFFRSVQRKERKHGIVYSPLLRLNSMINNVILSRQSPVVYHELYNTKKYIHYRILDTHLREWILHIYSHILWFIHM